MITAILAAAALAGSGDPRACRLGAPDAAHAGGPGCAQRWMDVNLRLNDLQSVGTHNSYKQAISPKLFALLSKNSKRMSEIDYAHRPLPEQLDDGMRALEIDVAYDPKGGLFANPAGPKLSGEPPPEGFAAIMAKPGFKVLHVQDIDFRPSCLTFVACLTIVRDWSRAHPGHAPLLITLNAKDDPSPVPGGQAELKFDAAAFDALDAEIRSVFAAREVITPDQVQGRAPTLRDAVLHGGWPTLGAARGKVVFALDEGDAKIALYRGARRSLEGRMLFVNAPESSPAAAYMTLNEALTDTAHIRAMVAKGFLVRTRADAETVEARVNDTRRREAAFASGAQVVSTDYPHPDERFGPYQVRLRGSAITVCNPVRTGTKCGGAAVEP